MSSYKLSKERLLEILKEAYEAGWSGPLDLSDSFALSLVEDKLEDVRCVENSQQLSFPFIQNTEEVASPDMDEIITVTQDMTFPEQVLLDWNFTTSLE